MVLVGKDRAAASRQLRMTDTYLRELGTSLLIPKCAAFGIKAASRTWYVKNPMLEIRGEPVSEAKPDETIRYLGATVGF